MIDSTNHVKILTDSGVDSVPGFLKYIEVLKRCAVEFLMTNGHVDPVALIIATVDVHGNLLVRPEVIMVQDNESCNDELKSLFQITRAVGYIHIAESWASSKPKPSEDPDRKECITITAEHLNMPEVICTRARILRDMLGRPTAAGFIDNPGTKRFGHPDTMFDRKRFN